MRWSVLFLPLAVSPGLWAAAPGFHVETQPVTDGAELLTVFGPVQDARGAEQPDVPLVSVLRDTLGDRNSRNDRLRYVWVLTSVSPSALQRALASLPFFYWRLDVGKNADRRPSPVIDLADTGKTVPGYVAGSLAQTMALDPNGMLVRSSTRSYRSNVSEEMRMHLTQALAVFSELEPASGAGASERETVLSESELLEIEARLSLAGRPFGGLVDQEALPKAYINQRTRTTEMRGHNWELLRQRAEANGLYFEPFGLGQSATHAILWIDRAEVASRRDFDGHFLRIANPYGDSRLLNWSGYTAIRYFDKEGRRVEAGTPGAERVELIPLALYSLDYPKVPLLLVDFRSTRAPKRREMLRRAVSDTISGVLGISKWGNWPYFAASWAWNFVTVRHGATGNRAARLNAYAEIREWLALDPSLDNRLRLDLEQRLDILAMNPLEESIFEQAAIARRQYAALLAYAADPKGLPARLERDRNAELTAYDHGLKARVGFRAAHLAALGLYTHRERPALPLDAELDRDRLAAANLRFLKIVAQSGPGADVVWNMSDVRRAIDQLASAGYGKRSAVLVRQILQQAGDAETRASARRALGTADGAGQ